MQPLRDAMKFSRLGQLLLGVFLLLLVLVGTRPFAGAVITMGEIEVAGNKQAVQHQTGGTIEKLFVANGDSVQKDQVLITLVGEDLTPELENARVQHCEVLAQIALYEAIESQASSIDFSSLHQMCPPEDSVVRKFTTAQQQLFTQSNEGLAERLAGLAEQLGGYQAQLAGVTDQIALKQTEIDRQNTLLDAGSSTQSKIDILYAELAQLTAQRGQVEAYIGTNKSDQASIVYNVVEEAGLRLNDLRPRASEYGKQVVQLTNKMERLELRAPSGGVVYGRTVDTEGGVITAGQVVMYIVPKDARLIARTRVEPKDIDQVSEGQPVNVRLSAFSQRTTPTYSGVVTRVSADVMTDPNTGHRYYEADVSLDEVPPMINGFELVPGMPVEAFLAGEVRTLISYFTKPLGDFVSRSFREV